MKDGHHVLLREKIERKCDRFGSRRTPTTGVPVNDAGINYAKQFEVSEIASEFAGADPAPPSPLDHRSTWLGGAQEEPTLNSSPTSPGMESLRRTESPMYASFIAHRSP